MRSRHETRALKKSVTIRLDPETIDYFKALSKSIRPVLLTLSCALLTASVCAAAERVPPPSAGTVELDSLRPGVWVHTSIYTYPDGSRFSSNGLVVRDGDGLTLIDTAWGERLTVSLLDRIERELRVPLRRAVVTHAHGDRTAGADVLRDRGIPVLAHPHTIELALESGLPPPSDSLSGVSTPGSAVTLGSIEIFYPGPAHAPENLMVWVRGAKVLFGGCAVRPGDATTLGNTAHASLGGWPLAIERARKRYAGAEAVVPGHGAVGGPDLLVHTLSLLNR